MKRSGKQFFIFTVIVCAGLVCRLGTAVAQTPSEFSTDEMLEYTLNSIRSKMDSALDQNKDLSAKNASIRQRILSFKKELRELDDGLIRLRQETIDLKNDIKLQSKELKIQEKHLNNILERKKHMLFERDSLKTQIETIQTQRGLLTQNVEDTRFDIQEVQGSLKGPADSTLLNYYSEEKLKFLEMIKDYAQRIAEKQDRLDRMELGIADQLREKEAALRDQESLKRMVEDLGFQFKEEQAKTALLRR
ncbi:MAG TPA: hypothetical protein VLJ10_02220, partial [Candidatus Bathyarchaeia archaeon]|nr:hypothetical protein [Candidatus Bathyarchaeia archaeon]